MKHISYINTCMWNLEKNIQTEFQGRSRDLDIENKCMDTSGEEEAGMDFDWYWHIYTSDVVVQSLSCVQLFVTPWTAPRQVSQSFTISWSLNSHVPEAVMPSNHLILCRLILLLLLS